MSRYFNPIEFPEEETPKVEPNKIEADKIDVSKILPKIEEEISKIQGGTSSYHKLPVQMSENSAVLVTFERLKLIPTRKNARMFLAATKQDISVRVAEHFTSLFQKEFGSL